MLGDNKIIEFLSIIVTKINIHLVLTTKQHTRQKQNSKSLTEQ